MITQVEPQIDGGRFPIKRVSGGTVTVTADILAEGHDLLRGAVRYRKHGEDEWLESEMTKLHNDRWSGSFVVVSPGVYEYSIAAWVDEFGSWRRDLAKKAGAAQDVSVNLRAGALRVEAAAEFADRAGASSDARELRQAALNVRPAHAGGKSGESGASPLAEVNAADLQIAVRAALDEDLAALMHRHASRRAVSTYEPPLRVLVDREKAQFSAWYEMFPRSSASSPGLHGKFEDCEARLPYVASMGFDVLYLPPIHPIGRTHRKGKNNSPVAGPADPGSPWAIGAAEGGHTSVHPQLGTIEDFVRLVKKAREHGLEVALDIAFQCSPDHPWTESHPAWFLRRPDGSIQYAENPPKKYEDIYPLDFECDDWRGLWGALKDVVLFWIEREVRIFRVDNPHTKPFAFWEWLIGEVKARDSDVIFLAEAFTRPKVMNQLAKLGFSQSYTYFTWRNTKGELTEYFTELPSTAEYFRPNLWPNTPDILNEYLQYGGRPAFIARLVLAATLGANYGIYGPAFELCENAPIAPGSEEYLNGEKYEIRYWDLRRPGSLSELITRVNRARRENAALQSDSGLCFHDVDNGQMIAYSKRTEDRSNAVLVLVNLDYRYVQSGWVTLRLEEFDLDSRASFQVEDLLTGAHYLWHGARNFIQLDPAKIPAHVFRIRRYVRTENDFDYYM